MSNVFFISDLHLGHKNIMKFGQRDFATIQDHDEAVIAGCNIRVDKRSLLWILGDVAMDMESIKLLDNIKCRKRLIMGNHDRFPIEIYQKYFEDIRACEKRYGVIMTHIPIHPNELQYRNWKYNLHGHIHDVNKDIKDFRYINCNVDSIGLIPMSLDELRAKIKLRESYR